MKNIYILLAMLCLFKGLQAQVSKTVEVTAGNLASLLTTTEMRTITDLTLTGTINREDFNVMRDSMLMLEQLDLRDVSVVSYTAIDEDNVIPQLAFMNKSTLISIQLPLTLKTIGNSAFQGCRSLTTVHIPETVTDIGAGTFSECMSLQAIEIPSAVKAIKSSTFQGCNSLLSITIPSSVTTIGTWAFEDCRSMTSITIPSSVTSIGSYAFYACIALTSLTIPPSLTTIEEGTFSSLTSLTSLTIPNSVTTIGLKAFIGCQSLTSITIPSSVTYLGRAAFMWCKDLKSVTLPPLITSIEDETFSHCENLDAVAIPSTVTSIGESAFNDCIGMTSIDIPFSVTRIGKYGFANCTSLTKVTFPSTLITIEDGAFYGCTGLAALVIPSSVSLIGIGAFEECRGLKDIYPERSIPLALSSAIFADTVKSTATLHVPYGSASVYEAATEWKDFNHIVQDTTGFMVSANNLLLEAGAGESPINITSTVPWEATVDQSWLTITPSSDGKVLTVRTEANQATTNRTALITLTADKVASQKITIVQKSDPEVVVVTAGYLGSLYSKEEKDTITSLTLAGTINFWDIKTIDKEMPLLKELDLSRTIMKGTRGPGYYHGEAYYYPDNWFPGPTIDRDNHISDYGFSNPLLTNVKLPSSLEVIGVLAFLRCTGLVSVTIPTTVSSIGYAAFEDCTSLDSITIPASVSYMSDFIFYGCSSLKKVNLQGRVTYLNGNTFGNCTSLTSVTLPPTLRIIGPNVFSNCTSLSTVTLPESLVGIEPDAFNNCTSLKTIYSYNPQPPYTEGSFTGIVKTATVYVPFGSGALYKDADGWKEFENIVETLPEFSLSANTVTVKANQGSTATMRIATDVVWSASNGQSWLETNPLTASEDSTVTFTANENTSDFGRVDTVTFTAGNLLPRRVAVIQEGLPGTIHATAGKLSTLLTPEALKGTVRLTITGEIDARDFYTMRDRMPLLSILDLSKATIVYDTLHGPYNRENSIPIYAFYNEQGKSSLSAVTLPDSLVEVDQVAFAYCTGLTTITLPARVNYLSYGAFKYCINLHSIYAYPIQPPFLNDESVFKGVNKATCILYVPYGSKELYAAADYWKAFENIVEISDLLLSHTTATVEATQGSTATVELTGNGQWTAAADQSWLKVSPQEGTGSQRLTFTANANTEDTLRLATVTVSATGMKDLTIIVSQKGMVTGMAEIDQNSPFMSIYPNPFTTELRIELSNPLFKEVNVDIFGISGQKIRSLVRAQKGAKISCRWDGRDEQGWQMPSGVYLLKVNVEIRKVVKK